MYHRRSTFLSLLSVSLVVTLSAVFPAPCCGFRLLENWSYEKLQKQSDLIVVAEAISAVQADKNVELELSPYDREYLQGVVTVFTVKAVLKGSGVRETIDVVHCEIKADASVPGNGPLLASFRTREGIRIGRRWLSRRPEYLLYLKARADNRYEMISGQYDSDLAVREILPTLDHDLLSQLSTTDNRLSKSRDTDLGFGLQQTSGQQSLSFPTSVAFVVCVAVVIAFAVFLCWIRYGVSKTERSL